MMINTKEIAIYGAGGHAREVAWLLKTYEENNVYDVVGYIEDGSEEGRALNGKPILSWDAFLGSAKKDTVVAVGIGDPRARRKIADKCAAEGFDFPALISHSVEM